MIRIQLKFGQGLDLISLGLPEDENWNFDVEQDCTLEDLKNVLLQMCEGALRYDQLRLRKKGSPEELVEYLGAEKACTSTYKPRPCTLLNHGIKNGSALEVDILLSSDEERAIYRVHAHEEAPRAHVAAQPEAAPGASICIDLTCEDSREGDNDVVLGLGPPSKRQRADFAGRDPHEYIDGVAAREVAPDPAPQKPGQQQPQPEQPALPQRQAQPQQKQHTPDREHPLEAQRSPQPCTVQGPQQGQEPTTQQQYGPLARRQAPGLPDQTAQAGQQVPERRQDHVQAATQQQPEGQPPQEPAPQQQVAAIQPIPTQRTSIQLETQQRQRGVPEPQGQRQQAAEGPLLHTPQRPPLPTVVRGKVEVARQQQPATTNHGAYGGQEEDATGRKADADDAAPHRRVTASTGSLGHWSVGETQALADAMERYGRCWVAIERETKLRDQKALRYKWRNLVTASENGWASTRGVQLPQKLRQQIDDLYKRLGR